MQRETKKAQQFCKIFNQPEQQGKLTELKARGEPALSLPENTYVLLSFNMNTKALHALVETVGQAKKFIKDIEWLNTKDHHFRVENSKVVGMERNAGTPSAAPAASDKAAEARGLEHATKDEKRTELTRLINEASGEKAHTKSTRTYKKFNKRAINTESDYIDIAEKLASATKNENTLLTAEQEQELAHRIQAGDKTAVNELAEANFGLVHVALKDYKNKSNGLRYADILGEGQLGLYKAASMFEPDKGRFYNYALNPKGWIHEHMRKACRKQAGVINISRGLRKKVSAIGRFNNEFWQQNGRYPSLDETSQGLEMSKEDILDAKNFAATNRNLSLDAHVKSHASNEDGNMLLYDIIGNNGSGADISTEIENEEIFSLVEEAITNLPRLDQRLLNRRYGREGFEPHTLKELSDLKRRRLSEKQISSKLKSIEGKLKKHLEKKNVCLADIPRSNENCNDSFKQITLEAG